MQILVDTNVLLRLVDQTGELYQPVRGSLRSLRQEGRYLCIFSQNCVEFWNVATRPADKNGFGLTLVEADRLLRLIERLFGLLPDQPEIYQRWRQLVVQFKVMGVQVHDARLVAAMQVNQMTHLLTLNPRDFARYASEGIVAMSPEEWRK